MSAYFSYRRPTKLNEYGLKRIPDYTELAYKEAVSKLRYFLSGTYAPSLRSYGGSASIKNLDESDADLDKKYPASPYNALSEYRPRPKLTAKYATLYADSLNNIKYSPQHTANLPTTTPVTSGVDISGSTNPDVINFIQKQEEYIEQLERESQYCRDELNNLLGKVKEVISENEHLHEAQKNKLISRMFHSYNGGSETDELDDLGDSTGLDSDNKVTPSKTRKSKLRSTKLEGPNIVFESRIAELEAQLAQAKIDLKKVQDENNENKRKLASGLVDSTCLDGFKRQIDNLQRDKSSLETQISKLKMSLEQKDGEFEDRYKRGSDTIEHQLREERNTLEVEIRRLKDELAKERSKIRELAGEGARRAIQERSAAEQRYTAHFDELQHDLAKQYDTVAKLQLDLERQRREENELKRELSMKSSAVDELKMELKNKTASLQADLAQAHAEKASLDEELASARLAIERQQRQAKHEANRLNSEIQSLRQRLDRADADLVHSRRENLRLTEQVANLEKELNMKSLTPMSPQKHKEKDISTALESIENKHAKTVAELESMIQSQNSLMEKLTGECRLLTDKLDDANRRHKEELATLQHQVENLGRSLQPMYTASPSITQAPAPSTPTSDGNVFNSEANSRSDDFRNISSGHSGLDQRSDESKRYNVNQQSNGNDRRESRSSLLSENVEAGVTNIQNTGPITAPYTNNINGRSLATEENYSKENYANYDQNQVPGNEYTNDENYKNYVEPECTDEQYGQYEENQQYNNYPQQYDEQSDFNIQYVGQNENYTTDANYNKQDYDNSQIQDYPAQNEGVLEENQSYTTDSQNGQINQQLGSNSRPEISPNEPIDNLQSQS
ncbi:hypothetical protein ACJJTC_011402 [Scirpophaga incertulas]